MKPSLKFITWIIVFLFEQTFAQNQVSITIDDVPNVELNHEEGRSLLLQRLTEMDIPVAIFINEMNVYKNGFDARNIATLERWLTHKKVSAGNHTFSHINYADTTLEGFQRDVVDGEKLTTQITHRRPAYFRFPFNSLGNDSSEHRLIKMFLHERGYTHAPFTIESEDWAYNAVYEQALKNGNSIKAKEIGQRYIAHTLSQFKYFNDLTRRLYGRAIRHIYLCHDNLLNTDHLKELVVQLKQRGYNFISLSEALEDEVYRSKEYYFGKYGFSWIYRWEKSQEARKLMMQNEPSNEALQNEYNKLGTEK